MKKYSVFIIAFLMAFTMSCAVPSFSNFAPTLTYTPQTPTLTSTIQPTSTPKIETVTPTNTPEFPKGVNIPKLDDIKLNMTLTYCDALWTNSQQNLVCPGDSTSTDGAVMRIDQPKLSGDVDLPNRALLTIPGYQDKGTGILGRYPDYTVDGANTYFLGAVTCLKTPCSAEFTLSYYAGDNQLHQINSWKVTPDQPWVKIDEPLSALNNKTVNFVLSVRNIDEHSRIEALWVEPLIYIKH